MEVAPHFADEKVAATLKKQVEQFLQVLINAQQELIDLQGPKKQALIARDFAEVEVYHKQEEACHRQLQKLLRVREQFIRQFNQQGIPGETLQSICRLLKWNQTEPFQTRLSQASQLAEQFRQECWSTWIFSHRAARHYATALNLISRGGKKEADYRQDPDSPAHSSGGSLFDASV